MRTIWRKLGAVAVAAVLGLAARGALAADKIKVLVIDGQNNHGWKETTPAIKGLLEKSGKFEVDVVTTPANNVKGDEAKAAWEKFRPEFAKYNTVLSNYNGQDWPEEVQKSFEKYMTDGGGLVIYHAANNPFPRWTAWNEMVGLHWQGPQHGDRITVDEKGEVVRTPKGEGPGAGHGPLHPYEMKVRDAEHPIMKGLPATWTHVSDELYHGQRGPGHMQILATAFSDKAKGGTGTNEPLVWVHTFGKGRIFVNLLGHAVPQTAAPDCATLLLRGTEWAATGAVTIPVPEDFPKK